MINGATDKNTDDFQRDLALYMAHARLNAVEESFLQQAAAMQRDIVHLISAAREEELLREAGFSQLSTFYKALWIQGWWAVA